MFIGHTFSNKKKKHKKNHVRFMKYLHICFQNIGK